MAWPDAGAQGLPGMTRGVGVRRPSGGAVLGGPVGAEAAPSSRRGGGGRTRRGGAVGGVRDAGVGEGTFPEDRAGPRLRVPALGRSRGLAWGRGPRGRRGFFRQTHREVTGRPRRASPCSLPVGCPRACGPRAPGGPEQRRRVRQLRASRRVTDAWASSRWNRRSDAVSLAAGGAGLSPGKFKLEVGGWCRSL